MPRSFQNVFVKFINPHMTVMELVCRNHSVIRSTVEGEIPERIGWTYTVEKLQSGVDVLFMDQVRCILDTL
jgi:hypothetical protein